jgi:tryptophanase
VYERRHQITNGFAIEEEAPIMRHFTVKLRRIK